jgi:hypothetical protein
VATTCLLLLTAIAVLEGQAIGTGASARHVQLRLLAGVAFGLVLPLVAFAASARVGGSLRELMTMSWARYGGNRRAFALGRITLVALGGGALTAIIGTLALWLGSATAAPALELPPSWINLLTVTWVALLGAAGYAAAFSAAHLYAGNAGRVLFLIADWILGSSAGALALPWPRAHLRTLLGGTAPLSLEPRDAALYLLAITAVATFLYTRRLPA